jgi:hypothetical protein
MKFLSMIAICIPLFSVFGFHGIIDKSNSQQQIKDVFEISLSYRRFGVEISIEAANRVFYRKIVTDEVDGYFASSRY